MIRPTPQQLQKMITIWRKKTKHTPMQGNCGSFAVGLNKVLGGTGKYIGVITEYEPELLGHVALKWNGALWDGYGRRTLNNIKLAAFDEEHPGQKMGTMEITERMALKLTEYNTRPEVFAKELLEILKAFLFVGGK